MNNLTQHIVDSILLEDKVTRTVAVFAGRFQPPHAGHFAKYEMLVKKFGQKNVYIGTSNVTDPDKSPFSFQEKKKIWTKIFGVPTSQVVQVKNPFVPIEILNSFNENTTAYVAAVGEKDSGRLARSKFFSKFTNGNLQPYTEHGYFYIVPSIRNDISGTQVRNGFRNKNATEKQKMTFFKKMFNNKTDSQIFNLVNKKLSESIVITKEDIENFVEKGHLTRILESSNVSAQLQGHVDDGPGFMFHHYKDYETHTRRRAQNIGYEVVNFIMKPDDFIDASSSPIYPDGPVGDTSFGPKGNVPTPSENERPERDKEEINANRFEQWKSHVNRFVELLGWEIVDFIGAKRALLGYNPKDIEQTRKDMESNFAIEDDTPELKDDPTLDEWIQREVNRMANPDLLMEGGAFGHMQHIFDDVSLTFGDMKNLITLSLQGNLEIQNEKTDGQNIMISWIDGKIRFARNKGHLKNFGANSLDISGVKSMFAGRGDISDAFSLAADDLNSAISSLSSKQKDKIFQNGHKFMSIEVIFAASQNVIPYESNMLIFHETVEVDEQGNKLSRDNSDAKILAGMIKQINKHIQNTFSLQGPPIPQLPKSQNFSRLQSKFIGQISSLQNKFKLRDNDTLSLYHQKWWETFVDTNGKKFKYIVPTKVMVGLVKRWAFYDKSFGIVDMRNSIDNKGFQDWAINFDKQDHAGQVKETMKPFEIIYLQLGTEILTNMKSALIVDTSSVTKKIRNSLASAIKELRNSKDIKKLAKLKVELQRIQDAGGMNSIVPTEGIVFTFKGRLFKITGSFSPINQLLGMLHF